MASGRSLSHFAVYALRPSFWMLEDEERGRVSKAWRTALDATADAVHVYRTFGTRPGSDALAWSAVRVEDPSTPARFFGAYAEALRPFRRYVRLRHALWGLTADSEYARGAPQRGIDPFAGRTLGYLVVYPFSKSHTWYATPADQRRSIMSEHIRVGRAHEGVEQLLLYSTGLQDHEFVVVYETDDLATFSALVMDLRATEARGYTLLDAPVHVGMHVGSDESGDNPWP